jgi:hypothetical protein
VCTSALTVIISIMCPFEGVFEAAVDRENLCLSGSCSCSTCSLLNSIFSVIWLSVLLFVYSDVFVPTVCFSMDQVMQYVEPAKQFAKDSIRLVKRCTKPDRKGNVLHNIFSLLGCIHTL